MQLNAKVKLFQRNEKQLQPDVVKALVQNTVQSVRNVTLDEVSYLE